MFAASFPKINQYQETGSCGEKSLDYAIGLPLNLSVQFTDLPTRKQRLLRKKAAKSLSLLSVEKAPA